MNIIYTFIVKKIQPLCHYIICGGLKIKIKLKFKITIRYLICKSMLLGFYV